MKVNELQPGEYFIFNGHKYKRLKKIPYHKDAWDCMDSDNRHRPFRGNFDVDPLQQRLNIKENNNEKSL